MHTAPGQATVLSMLADHEIVVDVAALPCAAAPGLRVDLAGKRSAASRTRLLGLKDPLQLSQLQSSVQHEAACRLVVVRHWRHQRYLTKRQVSRQGATSTKVGDERGRQELAETEAWFSGEGRGT